MQLRLGGNLAEAVSRDFNARGQQRLKVFGFQALFRPDSAPYRIRAGKLVPKQPALYFPCTENTPLRTRWGDGVFIPLSSLCSRSSTYDLLRH